MLEEKETPFEGKATDLGIMDQMDVSLRPHQPEESIEYRKRMEKEQFPYLNGPVAQKRVGLTPEEASRAIKEKAFELGADLVGFTELDPRFVVKGEPVGGRWAISVLAQMDHQKLSKAPDARSGIEVTRVYHHLGELVMGLAAHIRSLGHRAIAHHPRTVKGRIGAILHKPIAHLCGLGEIGRNTLLITPEFGPRVRIATITTELEVVPGRSMDLGITKFCDTCNRCLRKCPTAAIPKERIEVPLTEVPGAPLMKVWRLDYRKCIPFFVKTDGCAICVKVCTFNDRPDKALELFNKTMGVDFRSRARSQ